MSGDKLMERWQDANQIYHFEGSTRNLSMLVSALGYQSDAFATPLENFLSDNPGAQGAIVDWIAGRLDRDEEWRAKLESEIGTSPEVDEDE